MFTAEPSLQNNLLFRGGRFPLLLKVGNVSKCCVPRRGAPGGRTCHQQPARGARHAEAIAGEAGVAAGVGARHVGQTQRAIRGQCDPESTGGPHLRQG